MFYQVFPDHIKLFIDAVAQQLEQDRSLRIKDFLLEKISYGRFFR